MDQIGVISNASYLFCGAGAERSAFDELIRSWERRLFFYVRRFVAT